MFGIHSSSFPPDFSVVSPDFSSVFSHVNRVLTYFPAIVDIPANLAASDESDWNVSREEFHACNMVEKWQLSLMLHLKNGMSTFSYVY